MNLINSLIKKFGLKEKITRLVLNDFIKKYSNDGKTLDIGCGRGFYSKYFPNRVGIDIVKTPAVDIIADVHNLNIFENGEFDIILCTEVLEHLHSPQKAINEMYRVLKIDGLMILTTRFIFPLHVIPDDYFRFTRFGLINLLKKFEIIEIKEETNTLETIAVLFQRIGFQSETHHSLSEYFFWLFLAKLLKKYSSKKKKYGFYDKEKNFYNLMTSGYYIACKKVK